MRQIFLLVASLLLTTGTSQADPCDCGDMKYVEAYDRMIFDRLAKIDFLKAGKFEDKSGMPNVPEILEFEISEIKVMQKRYTDKILACRKACLKQQKTEVMDHRLGITLPLLESECPKCYIAFLKYKHSYDYVDTERGHDFFRDQLLACNLRECRPYPDGLTDFDSFLEDTPEDTESVDTEGLDLGEPVSDGETAMVAETQPVMPPTLALDNPLMRSTGHCDFKPGDVCDKLGPVFAANCRPIVTEWTATCKTVFPRTTASLSQCKKECDVFAAEAHGNLKLLPMILEVIRSKSGNLVTDRERELLEETKRLAAQIKELEQTGAERVIHIYTNENSGEIIQHDGDYFEPSPPLVYNGSMPGSLTVEQRSKLDRLVKEFVKGNTQLETLSDGDSPQETAARAMAEAIWMGPDGPNGLGCSDHAQIETERAGCHAFCAGQTIDRPHVRETCQPIAIMGMLNQPLSRTWIYPEGHPWRAPGFGRLGGP